MRTKNEKFRLPFAPTCFMVCCLLLWASPAGAAETYKIYANDRFGYSVEYPDIFWSRFESDNGDGVRLNTANGHSELAVWGQHNIKGQSARARLKERLADAAHLVPGSAASGPDWYRLTTSDDGGFNGVEHHFLEYGVVTKSTMAVFTFKYPADMGFEAAAEHLRKTLKFGPKAGEAMNQVDLRSINPDVTPQYEVDPGDGNVYRLTGNEKTPVGEARQAESEMGLYYWFPVPEEAEGALKGSASGLYFFYESGGFIAFLPTTEAEFAGEARLSPTAQYVLIDFGTSPERDLRLYDFQTLKEKRAFLAMNEIVWLDARRFALTYVDTSKKARAQNTLESGWLSAAMYDLAAEKLTPIREATETNDFMLNAVDLEAKTFTIVERSVKTSGDWADEAKIENRDVTVKF